MLFSLAPRPSSSETTTDHIQQPVGCSHSLRPNEPKTTTDRQPAVPAGSTRATPQPPPIDHAWAVFLIGSKYPNSPKPSDDQKRAPHGQGCCSRWVHQSDQQTTPDRPPLGCCSHWLQTPERNKKHYLPAQKPPPIKTPTARGLLLFL